MSDLNDIPEELKDKALSPEIRVVDKEDPHKFDEYQQRVLDLLERIADNTAPRYRGGGPL